MNQWIKEIWKKNSYVFLFLFLAVSIALVRDVRSVKKKVGKITKKISKSSIDVFYSGITTNLPRNFRSIYFADDEGILISTKKIKINGMAYPYNSSLLEKPDHSGYYMFFRYDIKKCDVEEYSQHALETYIGVAELDKFFQHKDHRFHIVDTGSCTAEDPRAFYHNGKIHLMYNDLVPIKPYCRSMHIAQVNPATWTLDYQTDLQLFQASMEKNWMPFVHNDTVHLIYKVCPHKIYKLNDPTVNEMQATMTPKLPLILKKEWEENWGEIRGGTPAKLVNGEYLTFFHSRTRTNMTNWYAMGAYTFEAEPPFRITSISEKPILFRGIYDSPHVHTSNSRVKCIFPSGFVTEKQGELDLIHVSVGENDVATKILTFNTKKLTESMRLIRRTEKPLVAGLIGSE